MSAPTLRLAARLAVALAALRTAMLAHGQMPVYFVDDDSPPGGDGLSWETAFGDLQDALGAFHKNGGSAEVRVAQGVYHPDRGMGDRAASFDGSVASGTVLNLFGGFAGIKAMIPGARDPAQYLTTLSGDLKGDDAGGFEYREDNTWLLLWAEGGGRLWIDGFTVTGGGDDGGSGGGIRVTWGTLDLSRCQFRLNQSLTSLGGAVYGTGAALNVRECEFSLNRARKGGAIYADSGAMRAVSSSFISSEADHFGGAVWSNGGLVEIVNCEFIGNRAWGGAAVYTDQGGTTTNSTFTGNFAQEAGAAVWNNGAPGELHNSVVWGNHSDHGDDLIGLTRVQASCIQGGWHDWGNIDADPLFRDAAGPDGLPGTGDEDLRLSAGSPCIDSASNPELPEDWFDLDADGDAFEEISLDLAGGPRRADDPLTADFGLGPAPVVDMGAYEYQPFCAADLDADGGLTLFDFLAFLNLFNAADPAADCTTDGVLDLFDFLCFTNAFDAGC